VQIQDKLKNISDLQQKIKEKEATIEKMSLALLKLKSRLSKFEIELCKFTVEKNYKDHPSSTGQLIVIQNVAQKKKHIDVIVNGKRHTYLTSFISSVASSKTDPNKFYLCLKDKSQEAFSSSVRDEVVAALSDHLTEEKS